jgi:hypothetical protein
LEHYFKHWNITLSIPLEIYIPDAIRSKIGRAELTKALKINQINSKNEHAIKSTSRYSSNFGYTGLSIFFKSISTSLFTCSTFLFKFEQFL